MKKTNTHNEGIITLSDKNYYPGLETLYTSIQKSYSIPVTCFDIGLTDEQKIHAMKNYPLLSIRSIPDTEDIRSVKEAFKHASPLKKPGKRVWPLWLCPFLISASPYQRVYWLDSDLVVLRRLDELFTMLEDGPVFTVENLAPECTANNPELYRLLPIDRQFNPTEPLVNGGVSGWDIERDQQILESYMYPIRIAREDQAVRNAISWHDQGALIWAIQRTGKEDRVLKDTRWNLCIRHSKAATKSYDWNPQVIEQLQIDETDACLLHWNGRKVPWMK
jgi:lipopolysaccharide biosynthesis glycosyltransferase